MATSHPTRRFLRWAKLGLAAALLIYLVYQATRAQSFARLVQQPKEWRLLAAALCATLLAVAISFVRWHLLVRTLGLTFRIHDAMRLGALGFLLNFVSLGSVGGDLFKAILLAKEQPGRRTEAVATVVVDRIIGLYALLIVACIAIWATGLGSQMENSAVTWLCDATYFLASLGTLAFFLLLVPGFTGGRVTALAERVPLVGHHVVRLLAAVRIYRDRLPVIFLAVAMSLVVHSLLTIAVYCIATGLPGVVPSLGEHFFVVPLSMIAGAIPITPNGLGTLEAAFEMLYRVVPQDVVVAKGTGTVVALGYRMATLCVAAVGAVYYFAARREVAAAFHDAEDLVDAV